jgi:hypothetical protein
MNIKKLTTLLQEARSKIEAVETLIEQEGNEEDSILSLLKTDLVISKTDGKQTIYQAKKTFKCWIDEGFKDWGLDVKQKPIKEIRVAVFEAVKDFTFKDVFNKPEKQAMTQSQIIRFCEKHPTWLRQEGSATLFLIKVSNEYFVADVHVDGDGLHVNVYRLEDGNVWDAGYLHRVVVPQL